LHTPFSSKHNNDRDGKEKEKKKTHLLGQESSKTKWQILGKSLEQPRSRGSQEFGFYLKTGK
jgi:hypothetical protein